MIFIQNIWHHKVRIVVILGCIAVLAAVIFPLSGIYPIAMVNGHFITEKQFQTAFMAASTYYKNVLKTYGQEEEVAKSMDLTELESETINNLIENKLISEKLSSDLGKELPYVLTEKLGVADSSSDLKGVATTLYEMSWDNFKREILTPQAMRGILSDQLFLKKEKTEDWLASAKKSANIKFFSSKFSWDGSGVVLHK